MGKTKETEINQETDMAENPEVTETETKKGPEMVEIELFKDDGKYKDDVFVAINGKTYQIQRGVRVKVPKAVKEVLDNSAKQDKAAYAYMEREQEKYSSEAKKLDIK